MKSQSVKHTADNAPLKGKLQPKLKVSTPGDAYEREADQMAEQVVKKSSSNNVIARSLKETAVAGKSGKNISSVDRKESDSGSVTVSPNMLSHLTSHQQDGEPLSDNTRSFMEDAFDRDFSNVRIHRGHDDAALSRDIRARAFTYGNDIYFNQGQFSPETPEGKQLLAHELTHVVQQQESSVSPDISRKVELRPPGKGEASAFDRVRELIDRLNQQSTAIQYKLDGNNLLYDVKDEKALSIFDMQMRSYLDMNAVVPLRLITGEGRVPKSPTTLGRLTFDQLITGYVDLEDLLATDRLAFQSILIHILGERFSSPNYARRIGGDTFTGAEYRAAHLAGHHAQAFHFQGVFKDPSIKFVYEEPKPGNKANIVFRSTEKKYEVFVIVSRTNEDISRAEVRVRDADHKWYTADEFLALNSTSAIQPTVQPQIVTGQSQRIDEVKAVEKAKEITNKLSEEASGTIMRKVNSESSISPSSDWIRDLNTSGAGSPLPEGSRKFMEDSFGADFSKVRIHIDPLAANLSEDIHAKAFTYNEDIYFNQGEFSPDSFGGKKLLAHELTHVLQQRGEKIKGDRTYASRQTLQGVIFRDKKKASDKDEDEDAEPDPKFANKEGSIDIKEKTLRIFKLQYVTEKYNKLSAALRKNRVRNKEERPNNQRDVWRAELTDKVKTGLGKKIKEKGVNEKAMVDENDQTFYFFKFKKGSKNARSGVHTKTYVIGSEDEVVKAISEPRWNRAGVSQTYHVDHILEWQIAEGYKQAHKPDNFWLWEASANTSAGSTLANLIEKTVDGIVTDAIDQKKIWKIPKRKTKKFVQERAKEVKAKNSDFRIEIGELVPNLKVKGDPGDSYDVDQTFTNAAALEGLVGMKEAEVNEIKGTKNKLSIMIGDVLRGSPLRIDNDASGLDETWIKGFVITKVFGYNANAEPGEQYASVQGELYRELKKKNLIKQTILDIPVYRIGFEQGGKGIQKKGLMYFGKIRNGFRDRIVTALELPASSPIEPIDAYFTEDREAVLEGKVKPSVSLLKGLEFDVRYAGDTLTVKKTFTTNDLKGKLPSPFDITNAEITLSVDSNTEFGAEGQVDFEIKNIGTGYIKGEKKGALVLTGAFEFEKGFFDESGIKVSYIKEPGAEEGKFSFHGFAKKISDKTLKSLQIDVSYENNILTARGIAETKLPGISKGTIEVITGQGQTSVVADFQIGDSIPGVKGGNLHFLFKKNDAGEYLIEASSEINTKFPGIPHVKLHGFYNSDGIFLFEGDAELHLGRFNGIVHFGVTNQEVDEKGQLTGKKGDKLIAFGKGEVDFKMTDWLNGKIGAEITPDARVILSGTLRPDPHLAITKQKDPINKEFGKFSLPQFTLFGIPKIAEIYVSASGGFFLNAGIGPLYLNEASLHFEKLDIEAPERTIITGTGKLDLPGYAQLGVQITITAGVGIALVDVSINLTGSLAFEIAGNAGFQMSFTWSVASGVKINEALATLKAKTALIAKLGGKLLIELDLFFTEVELYSRPFDIGEKRWPLPLELDLKFPLGFESGDAGKFKLPHPDEIKHDDPKVDKETVKKGAMEDPPDATPAPGKEEALWKTRHLKADATMSGWIARLIERYSYVDGLKKKYPDVNWGYLDEELQILDAKEFRKLHDTLLYKDIFPRSEFGKNLRLSAVSNFEEEHRYVNLVEAAALRSKIHEMTED